MPARQHPLPKCYLVVAYAPPGTSATSANAALNALVSDDRVGLALTHDHFVDRQGGFAVFACDTDEQVARLQAHERLAGWSVALHPLTFADTAPRWLYQMDFTMAAYRGQRLETLWRDYQESKEYAALNHRI